MKKEKPSVGLEKMTRRGFFSRVAVGIAVLTCPSYVFSEAELYVDKSFMSPENDKRRNRDLTDLIILHTSEGNFNGIYDVKEKGSAHYFIDDRGGVHQVIDDDKVAHHAGTSMWEGRTKLNDSSIGIEMQGSHKKDITAEQYRSLRNLLSKLKRKYGIKDERILTHSMVSYGEPNRWHPKPHRYRKCAMLLASPKSRKKMGLGEGPGYDPDVRAGRLVVAEPGLEKVLYGSKSPKEPEQILSPTDEIKVNTRREDKEIESLRRYLIRTKMFKDYEIGRLEGDKRTPYSHAGKNWKSPSTYYMIGKRLHKASEIDPRKLPLGTIVLYKAK